MRKSKKIEMLENNNKILMKQNTDLRASYVQLQKDFANYKNTCELFIETVKELQKPKKKSNKKATTKKVVKKEKKSE